MNIRSGESGGKLVLSDGHWRTWALSQDFFAMALGGTKVGKRGIVTWDPMGLEGVAPHYGAHKGFGAFADPKLAPTIPLMNIDQDAQMLRMWALFWDEISFPVWDDAILGAGTDIARLWDEGLMSPFPVSWDDVQAVVSSRPHTPAARTAFIQSFVKSELEKSEPGQWSIEIRDGADFGKPPEGVKGRDTIIKLYDSIPLPAKAVSWKKVLDFRRKRSDELITLRTYIEDVYQKILAAGDGELALETEKDRLEKAIRDYLVAMNERNFRLKWANLEARIRWEFEPSLPLVGAAAGYVLGGPAMSAIAGVSSALLPKIEISTGASIEGAEPRKSPFAYVGSLHKRL